MRKLSSGWLVFGCLTWLCAACGVAESDSATRGEIPTGTGTTGTGGSGSTGGGVGAGGAGGGGGATPPPETEVEKAFEAPVATGRYVWAANPKTGRVALIDATTFQVKTVPAGQGPTFLAALPGKDDRAVVLNVLSNDATYLAQGADGSLDVRTYQVAPRANSWAISSDARFAIAWTDVTKIARPDSIEGFQQISIIDLSDASAPSRVPVRTVGFRPSAISFSIDPPRAFAVTEDGITVIDLSAPRDPKVVRTIKLDVPAAFAPGETTALQADADTPDGGASDGSSGDLDAESDATPSDTPIDRAIDDAPGAMDAVSDGSRDAGVDAPSADAVSADVRTDSVRADGGADGTAIDGGPTPPAVGKADVSITANGAFAIYRREGSAIVTAIDLSDGSRWSWTLPGAVTDLDLADTSSRAVAVVRGESRVGILPVPGRGPAPFDDIALAGETVGSVVIAPGGDTALLYTNAVAINRITALDLANGGAPRTIALHAPVLSVFPSSTAQHAIVVHNSFKGTSFTSPGAFSVVPIGSDQSAAIQATDAVPLSVALSPNGDRALVPVRDDTKKIFGVYLARMPSLVVDRYALASPPTAAGFVGAVGQAFVAQEHPAGRVSFIDPATEQVRTITGFELGASVVEWTRKDGGK